MATTTIHDVAFEPRLVIVGLAVGQLDVVVALRADFAVEVVGRDGLEAELLPRDSTAK